MSDQRLTGRCFVPSGRAAARPRPPKRELARWKQAQGGWLVLHSAVEVEHAKAAHGASPPLPVEAGAAEM